jgi:hypothetical protein
MIFLCWCNVLRWIWCLWCYSECISTPGKLEKYAWPLAQLSTYFHMFFSVPLVAFLVSFHVKTGFPLPWDYTLSISSRVNAVAHRMLAKHADTFTHVSQSIWESRLWREKKALSEPCLVYSLLNTCTNTQSPLLTSKSYQALLSGIFSSVKAY